jgi:hypothetical protein
MARSISGEVRRAALRLPIRITSPVSSTRRGELEAGKVNRSGFSQRASK